MADDDQVRIIPLRITSGTAKMEFFPSVLPQNKSEREKFWVEILVQGIKGLQNRISEIRPNDDDSHGQHDVIIYLTDESAIGVQVTELTHELYRKRCAMRSKYLEKLTNAFKSLPVHCEKRAVLKLNFNGDHENNLTLHNPMKVAKLCQEIIDNGLSTRVEPSPFGSIAIQELFEGDFYVPNVGNIGIDVDIYLLPRCLETYISAIDLIAEKKKNSKSHWLLIWSLSFYQDKHLFEKMVVEHMREVFSRSNFSQVIFLETMDGEGFFQANLKGHNIKPQIG